MTDQTHLTDQQLSAAVAVEVMGAKVIGKPEHAGLWAYATDPVQATELLEHERREGRQWEISARPRAGGKMKHLRGAYLVGMATDDVLELGGVLWWPVPSTPPPLPEGD